MKSPDQRNLFLENLTSLEPLCAAATHKQSQKPWDDAHGFWVSFALYFGWVYLPIFTRDRSNFDISADTTTRWFTMTKVCVIFATVEDVVRLDFGVFQAAANISQFDEILTQWKIIQLVRRFLIVHVICCTDRKLGCVGKSHNLLKNSLPACPLVSFDCPSGPFV